MKIGILTLPLHTNYGGILQAWALQTVLERMGHETILFQKEKVIIPSGISKIKIFIKRIILKYILHRQIYFDAEKRSLENYKIKSVNTQRFINSYLNCVVCDKMSEFDNSELKLKTIVVGSDQIWRPRYITETLRENVDVAFLSFAKNWDIKRISYAASFGTDDWEYTEDQTMSIIPLIKSFDGVSVRESTGVDLCKKYFGISVKHVLDPTMLLIPDDYSALIDSCEDTTSHDKILFNYVLDSNPQIESLIEKVADSKQLNVYRLSDGHSSDNVQPPVEEWLCSIRDAEFIITDSFHACVFCILFNKPFIVIGNNSRGYGRFVSLTSMFNLSKNLITEPADYDDKFDYTPGRETYAVLERLKNESMDFLNFHLG